MFGRETNVRSIFVRRAFVCLLCLCFVTLHRKSFYSNRYLFFQRVLCSFILQRDSVSAKVDWSIRIYSISTWPSTLKSMTLVMNSVTRYI